MMVQAPENPEDPPRRVGQADEANTKTVTSAERESPSATRAWLLIFDNAQDEAAFRLQMKGLLGPGALFLTALAFCSTIVVVDLISLVGSLSNDDFRTEEREKLQTVHFALDLAAVVFILASAFVACLWRKLRCLSSESLELFFLVCPSIAIVSLFLGGCQIVPFAFGTPVQDVWQHDPRDALLVPSLPALALAAGVGLLFPVRAAACIITYVITIVCFVASAIFTTWARASRSPMISPLAELVFVLALLALSFAAIYQREISARQIFLKNKEDKQTQEAVKVAAINALQTYERTRGGAVPIRVAEQPKAGEESDAVSERAISVVASGPLSAQAKVRGKFRRPSGSSSMPVVVRGNHLQTRSVGSIGARSGGAFSNGTFAGDPASSNSGIAGAGVGSNYFPSGSSQQGSQRGSSQRAKSLSSVHSLAGAAGEAVARNRSFEEDPPQRNSSGENQGLEVAPVASIAEGVSPRQSSSADVVVFESSSPSHSRSKSSRSGRRNGGSPHRRERVHHRLQNIRDQPDEAGELPGLVVENNSWESDEGLGNVVSVLSGRSSRSSGGNGPSGRAISQISVFTYQLSDSSGGSCSRSVTPDDHPESVETGTQTDAPPAKVIKDAMIETSLVWREAGFHCTNCSKPPRMPGTVLPDPSFARPCRAHRGRSRSRSNSVSSSVSSRSQSPNRQVSGRVASNREEEDFDGLWVLQSPDPTTVAEWSRWVYIKGSAGIDARGQRISLSFDGGTWTLWRGPLTRAGVILHRDGTCGKRMTYMLSPPAPVPPDVAQIAARLQAMVNKESPSPTSSVPPGSSPSSSQTPPRQPGREAECSS